MTHGPYGGVGRSSIGESLRSPFVFFSLIGIIVALIITVFAIGTRYSGMIQQNRANEQIQFSHGLAWARGYVTALDGIPDDQIERSLYDACQHRADGDVIMALGESLKHYWLLGCLSLTNDLRETTTAPMMPTVGG